MRSWLSLGSVVLAAALVVGACGGRRGGGGDDDDDDDAVGGGDSGLSRSEQVGDLDPAEVETLCDWGTEQQGGEGTVHECQGGLTVRTEPASECVDDLSGTSCDITVGDIEDCMNAIAPDPCILVEDTPPSCMPMMQCAVPDA